MTRKNLFIAGVLTLLALYAIAYGADSSQNFSYTYEGGFNYYFSLEEPPTQTPQFDLNPAFLTDSPRQANISFDTSTGQTFWDEVLWGFTSLIYPPPAIINQEWISNPASSLTDGYKATVQPYSQCSGGDEGTSCTTRPYTMNATLFGTPAENTVLLPELAAQGSLIADNQYRTLTITGVPDTNTTILGVRYFLRSQHADCKKGSGFVYGIKFPGVGGGGSKCNFPVTGWQGFKPIGFSGTIFNQDCGSLGQGPRDYCEFEIQSISRQSNSISITYRYDETAQINLGNNYIKFWLQAGHYIATPPQAPAISASCSVSPYSITSDQSATWTASASGGAGNFSYEWQGTDGLSGSSASVSKTYTSAGTKTASVKVYSGGQGTDFIQCSTNLTVNNAPPSISVFTANPNSFQLGNSTRLSWFVSGDINLPCTASRSSANSGDWQGNISQSNGSRDVTPTQTGQYTYTLSCAGPAGSDSESVNVNVSNPTPSADIKANDSNGPITIDFNGAANISWTSVYAAFPQFNGSCSVSKDSLPFASGVSGGQSTGNLTGSVTYNLNCSGGLGSISDSVRINLSAPTLSANLDAIPLPPQGTTSNYTTTLVAGVSGTAIGTINYSLWWSCPNSTNRVDIAEADSQCGQLPHNVPAGSCSENSVGVKCEALNPTSLSRTHTFSCPGGGPTCNFRPKVITERMDLRATNAVGLPLITILPPPAYFRLSKSGDISASVSAAPTADSTKTNITVSQFNDFSSAVDLSVSGGLPAGAAAHFGPSGASTITLSPPFPKSVEFWVTVPRATSEGSRTINIFGSGGGITDTLNVGLNVSETSPEFKEI